MKHLFLILLLITFSCINKSETNYLGIVDIEITGEKQAIPYFEKGLLLLHSFEYDDAREEFVRAQQKDPKMAMAYWGEAMTHNHSLWSEQNYDEGRAALNKLNDIEYDLDITELEQDFIEAARILYKPKLDKKQRDKDYSKFMARLNERYPKNHEVAAFYALSLLGAADDGRDEALYGQGAKIAQGIIDENPKHPGALHYLIHSYDDPEHAHLALDAANLYSKVAPDASHALHMPSHIYVAKGMWQEVISSNINSYQASLTRMNSKNLGDDDRGYHAYHWLEYGYLQAGQIEEARNMVLKMEGFMNAEPSKRARSHMVFIKGSYLAETDEWNSEIANIPVVTTDLNISIRSQYHFMEGMKAINSNNKDKLDSIIGQMEQDHNRESYLVSNEDITLCAAITRDQATPSDILQAEVRILQLKALKANMQSNTEKAEQQFLASIELNDKINYSYGPPMVQKPVHELFAFWLLSQNRADEAIIHFEKSLRLGPERNIPLKGIEKAAHLL